MEKTLIVLKQMKDDGLIADYAIGGAVGALFYMEPVLTFDLDVFIRVNVQKGGLDELSGILAWLREQGYYSQGEHVVIAGIPVQFLPAVGGLLGEALDQALDIPFKKTSAWVIAPEYLAAIMLQTGRSKDKERLIKFLGEAKLQPERLKNIIDRYKMQKAWQALSGDK